MFISDERICSSTRKNGSDVMTENKKTPQDKFIEYFDYCVNEKVSHPSRYLLSNNGPFQVQGVGVKKILKYFKYRIKRSWQVTKPMLCACHGAVLSRKEGVIAE